MSKSSYDTTVVEFDDDDPISRVHTRVVGHERAVRAEIAPRMTAVFAHLRAFVERADETPVSVRLDYAVEGAGVLVTDHLTHFKLSADDRKTPARIALRCEARGKKSLKILPPKSEDYFALRRALFDQRLLFTSGIAATVSKITLQPVVPISLKLVADYAGARIRLRAHNVGQMGIERFDLKPAAVDARFLAGLECYLCGEAGALCAAAT